MYLFFILGIAPFRGFWQRRQNSPKFHTLLYYGCRDESENLFADEDGSIVRRKTAYSRSDDPDHKKYVQELEQGKEGMRRISDWCLNRTTYTYICGLVSFSTLFLETVGFHARV